jgi:hypothetical protein
MPTPTKRQLSASTRKGYAQQRKAWCRRWHGIGTADFQNLTPWSRAPMATSETSKPIPQKTVTDQKSVENSGTGFARSAAGRPSVGMVCSLFCRTAIQISARGVLDFRFRLSLPDRCRFAARSRQQHSDFRAISAVLIAEQRDQIALFEIDANQNVARSCDRE